MASPDFGELRRVEITPDLLSRGSGERIPLQEAVVYDFMPRILGSRFAGVTELRRAAHFTRCEGSFMMTEEAQTELAEAELNAGNLTPALEAYKRGLNSAVGFVGAMAAMQDHALLSPAEVDRLNLGRRFGALEDRLIQQVVSQDIAFNSQRYIEWLNNVRKLEKDALSLNQQYFRGNSPLSGDPATGMRLRDTYAEMQRYKDAAWISKKLGDTEKEAEYTELAKTDPTENPKYQPIIWRIQKEYDRSRGYI